MTAHSSDTWLDGTRLVAWRAFLNAHAAVIERIERDLAVADRLPLGAYDVLVALVQAPDERLRMGDLAQAIVLNKSTLTRRVDRLERAGLLTRERHQGDKRGAYAVLTERGRAAVRAAWPIYARGIQAHFGRHLTDDTARALTQALTRITDEAHQPPSSSAPDMH
jgi:DNA-binding MarR family transcriptional regulator